MSNDRIDQHIDEAARRLQTPPDVPQERLWARIDAARRPLRAQAAATANPETPPVDHPWRRKNRLRRWWPAAAAALLVLGFGLGRLNWSLRPGEDLAQAPPQMAGEPTAGAAPVAQEATPVNATTSDQKAAWTTATTSMFLRAEALLTAFDRSDTPTPIADPVPRWAGLLLYETRTLMDAPAADDPELLSLLEDLELVLAQITQLRVEGGAETPTTNQEAAPETFDWTGLQALESDRAWIADGLAKRATLQRLRQHTQADAEQKSL